MRKKLLALLLTLCMVLSLLPVTAMAVEGNVSQETGYGNAALPAAPAVTGDDYGDPRKRTVHPGWSLWLY